MTAFGLVNEVALFHARKRLAAGAATRVYAICEEGGDAWKFGIAGDPVERLASLQVGNPRALQLYAHAPGTRELERAIHYRLRRDRLAGEWFRGSPRVLAVAELVKAAGEQCRDLDRYDCGPADVGDSIAAVTYRIEEVLAPPLPSLPRVELASPAGRAEA